MFLLGCRFRGVELYENALNTLCRFVWLWFVFTFFGLQILCCGILSKRVQEFMLKWRRNSENNIQIPLKIYKQSIRNLPKTTPDL